MPQFIVQVIIMYCTIIVNVSSGMFINQPESALAAGILNEIRTASNSILPGFSQMTRGVMLDLAESSN